MITEQNQTVKQYFTTLTIIHGALIMGQVLFAGVAFYLNTPRTHSHEVSKSEDINIYITVGLAIAGVTLGHLISSSKTKALLGNKSLPEKLNGYRSALIIRYALLEVPSLFAIVNYLLSGNLIFLTISAMLVAINVLFRPTKGRAILDLELGLEEKKILEDPVAII